MWYLKLIDETCGERTEHEYGPFTSKKDAMNAWDEIKSDAEQEARDEFENGFYQRESGGWCDGKLKIEYWADDSRRPRQSTHLTGVIFFDNDGEFEEGD